jgi:hypothetical protein
LIRAARVGVALAGLLLVVLTASGAWLWWNYRPDRDQWVRTVHQVAAVALLVVAVALVIVAIVRRARVGAAGIVASVGVLVTVGAAYVLGRLIAWDGLGLHAVVADVKGVDGALGSSVFLVAVDGHAVAPSTYAAWAYAHLVLAALAVLALVLAWLRGREGGVTHRPRRVPEPEPDPLSAS